MNNLLNKLDVELINNYNYVYGSESEQMPQWFFDNWANAKSKYLLKLFGGQLIHEKEILYGESPVEIVEKLCTEPAYKDFHKDMIGMYAGFDVRSIEGIADDEVWKLKRLLNELIDGLQIVQNKINFNHDVIICGRRFKVQRGAKTMKALQKVLTALNYPYMGKFEQMRQLFSQYTQEQPNKGTLCISIHPMDYMTMSDNDNNWESCMSWRHDGSHREGTLACVNGESCVVVYLKTDDMCMEDIGVWNDKKWRQLIAISPTALVTNRHYPKLRPDVESQAIDMLRALAKANLGVEYEEVQPFSHNMGIRYSTGEMYSDLGPENSRVARATHVTDGDRPYVEFGGEARCLSCGDHLYDGDGGVTCHSCRGEEYCICCEEYVDSDSMHETADGDYVCSYCLENNHVYCDECEQYHWKTVVTHVKELDVNLCEVCYKNVMDRLSEEVKKEEE